MRYPVKLTDMDGEFMVTSPDFPRLHSVGDTPADALREAADALETMIQTYVQDRQTIPPPSPPKRGYRLVALSPRAVAKIGLYEAMLAQGLSKAELARRLGVHRPQVDRLLDLRYESRLEQVVTALAAVGRRIELQVLAA